MRGAKVTAETNYERGGWIADALWETTIIIAEVAEDLRLCVIAVVKDFSLGENGRRTAQSDVGIR